MGRDARGVAALLLMGLVAMLAGIGAASAVAGEAAEAKALGRLFTSAAERERLDRQRRENIPEIEAVASNPSGNPAKEIPKPVAFNGVVQRSDGAQILWINGQQVEGRQGPDGVRVHHLDQHSGQVQVTVPGNNGSVRLKPGEVWMPGDTTRFTGDHAID